MTAAEEIEMTSEREKAVRRLFEAYRTKDRALIESLIADDFSFTSPYDDAIDRRTYFERCWPNTEVIEEHILEKVVEDGDDVVVQYLCRTRGGKTFRNVEVMTVGNGQIGAVHIYFGAAYRNGAFVKD